MTLYEIKVAVATYFKTTVADLTQNSQDLFLVAANQVRRQAEMIHDFEFSRKLVTVSVNGVTGGSLENAVLYGTSTPVNVKTVIEAGLFDSDANLRPVEWTSVSEGIERQRIDNNMATPRYPTDSWYSSEPAGFGRFELAASSVYRWPKDTANNFTLGLEVYSIANDWTYVYPTVVVTGTTGLGASMAGTYNWVGSLYGGPAFASSTGVLYYVITGLTSFFWVLAPATGVAFVSLPTNCYQTASSNPSTPPASLNNYGSWSGTATLAVSTNVSDTWTTHASQYLMWGIIIHLNYYYKEFVLRQEGNLGSPEKLRDEALEAFVAWDAYRFEQNRRHGR